VAVNATLAVAKMGLGPILLPQAAWLRRTALRLPEAPGPREGEIGEGEPRLRLLVVGDSSAAGVGLADQAQGLALPLAHKLSERLQGAVSWQLVARTGINTAEARELIAKTALRPADVVVTVLGVNDVSSQKTAQKFVEETALLWSDLKRRTGARWAVLSGLPPMHLLSAVPQPLRWYLGRYAAWLDGAVRFWAEEQGLGHCALQWAADPAMLSHDGFHPGPALYPVWTDRLAEMISAQLTLVRPDLTPVRADLTPPVRPELVEGPFPSPSADSPP
jgi:lysophospholipase L1-like esterase